MHTLLDSMTSKGKGKNTPLYTIGLSKLYRPGFRLCHCLSQFRTKPNSDVGTHTIYVAPPFRHRRNHTCTSSYAAGKASFFIETPAKTGTCKIAP